MYVEEYLATKALLEEVGTTPKPGLVDRLHSGAHSDMDHATFVSSTFALKPFFGKMAAAGAGCDGSLETLFDTVRSLGIVAEQAMFAATGGVNTHKGLLFCAGILSSVSTYAKKTYARVDADLLCALVQEMTWKALDNDFATMKKKAHKSHGELLFANFGINGVRGEVQQGFPSVRTFSLPAYTQYLKQGKDPNLARIQTLLLLMSKVQDTNVLYRHGWGTLAYVQDKSKQILQCGGAFSKEGLGLLSELDNEFTKRRISPGGCADLLAVTILLHDLGEN